jgi:hypothetical protein
MNSKVKSLLLGVCIVLCAGGVETALSTSMNHYRNEKLGFSLSVPDRWSENVFSRVFGGLFKKRAGLLMAFECDRAMFSVQSFSVDRDRAPADALKYQRLIASRFESQNGKDIIIQPHLIRLGDKEFCETLFEQEGVLRTYRWYMYDYHDEEEMRNYTFICQAPKDEIDSYREDVLSVLSSFDLD